MLLSPGSADKVSKIRVKNREPVPSYRMDRNDDEIDAMMVSLIDFYSFTRCVLNTLSARGNLAEQYGSRSLTLRN